MTAFMPDIEAAVVVLTNKGGHLLTFATAFYIYDKLMGKKSIDWNGRLKIALEEWKKAGNSLRKKNDEAKKGDVTPPDPSDLLTGIYIDPAYGKIEISLNSGKLFFKFNSMESRLKHFDKNVFIIEDGILSGSKIEFIKNDSGEVGRISIPLEKDSENIIFKK